MMAIGKNSVDFVVLLTGKIVDMGLPEDISPDFCIVAAID